MPDLPPIRPEVSAVMIGGPTASGKSDLALRIAEKFNGEIISVDSMQVYRGMDIGTDKPSKEIRGRVAHHLVDICDLSQSFDAKQFIDAAGIVMADILQRGRLPIFCGGTGLYFNALLFGIGTAPGSDPVLRADLEKLGLEQLASELKERDPASYEIVDRKNKRRLVRAVEIARLGNGNPGIRRAEWSGEQIQFPFAFDFFCLEWDRDTLVKRIHARVDAMFQRGLVEETRELMRHGLTENRTASQALGYSQVMEFLKGRCTADEAKDMVKIRTRQFAKRQMTWFRRQLPVTWIVSSDSGR